MSRIRLASSGWHPRGAVEVDDEGVGERREGYALDVVRGEEARAEGSIERGLEDIVDYE